MRILWAPLVGAAVALFSAPFPGWGQINPGSSCGSTSATACYVQGGGGGDTVTIGAPLGSSLSAASVAVVIASDQAPISANLTKVNGTTVLVGSGGTGIGGAQRVVEAQDASTIAGSAPGPAGSPSISVVSVQGVSGGTAVPTSQIQRTAAAATTTTIATGGTAVTAVTGPVNGCMINNPLTATGEGIAAAETLFVNFVGAATTTEGGNVFALQPGQPFNCPVGFVGNISANAATTSHKFSAVVW